MVSADAVIGTVTKRATQYGAKGLDEINKLVQQGPTGLSILCFGGNIALIIIGIREFAIFDFLSLTGAYNLLTGAYVVLFGSIGFLLESDVSVLKKIPILKAMTPHIGVYQETVNEYALFLTNLKGRGVYYLFVGSLCITHGTAFFCIFFYVGIYICFVGVGCILLSYGIKPDVSSDSLAAMKNRAAAIMTHRDEHQYKQVER